MSTIEFIIAFITSPFILPAPKPKIEVVNDEILKKLVMGRERIVNGWCRYHSVVQNADDSRKYCANGAIEWNMEAATYLYRSLPQSSRVQITSRMEGLPDPDSNYWKTASVSYYNDSIAYSKESILRLYEDAIALRRSELN